MKGQVFRAIVFIQKLLFFCCLCHFSFLDYCLKHNINDAGK